MIHWGTRETQRLVGYVADFCPLCRELRPFALRRIGKVFHVYWISFGAGELVEHHRVCTACGTRFVAKPEDYKAVEKQLRPLPELIAATYPNVKQVYAQRLELERSLRNPFTTLEPGQRAQLLREPFLLLAPGVEWNFNRTHFDAPTLWTFFGGLFIAQPALVGLVEALQPEYKDATAVLASVAVLIASGVLMAGSGDRWIRNRLIPVLAGALRPLKPTQAEIQGILNELRTQRRRIGLRVELEALLAVLSGQGRGAVFSHSP